MYAAQVPLLECSLILCTGSNAGRVAAPPNPLERSSEATFCNAQKMTSSGKLEIDVRFNVTIVLNPDCTKSGRSPNPEPYCTRKGEAGSSMYTRARACAHPRSQTAAEGRTAERGRVLDRGRERSLGSDGIAATSQAASYLRRLRDSGGREGI